MLHDEIWSSLVWNLSFSIYTRIIICEKMSYASILKRGNELHIRISRILALSTQQLNRNGDSNQDIKTFLRYVGPSSGYKYTMAIVQSISALWRNDQILNHVCVAERNSLRYEVYIYKIFQRGKHKITNIFSECGKHPSVRQCISHQLY